ncbi:hypothetical protein [Rhodococcus xishaensis]|uniref:Uncharacterized protein n=1 Tax=Rhodococcus xishaensis TaxID=2487364 RepID=A0A3S3DXX4_9NOCA|nr:hypothetical protein [Rhodococcus xishaensis]RVW00759.1 hypothetical protein EGT50_15660 [Rhodococcus xishaensis]
MELRTNGSMTQPMSGTVRTSMLRDLDLGVSNSVRTVLWWASLMLMVAVVPALAAFLLMGSVALAVTIGLISVGGVSLAALMI